MAVASMNVVMWVMGINFGCFLSDAFIVLRYILQAKLQLSTCCWGVALRYPIFFSLASFYLDAGGKLKPLKAPKGKEKDYDEVRHTFHVRSLMKLCCYKYMASQTMQSCCWCVLWKYYLIVHFVYLTHFWSSETSYHTLIADGPCQLAEKERWRKGMRCMLFLSGSSF